MKITTKAFWDNKKSSKCLRFRNQKTVFEGLELKFIDFGDFEKNKKTTFKAAQSFCIRRAGFFWFNVWLKSAWLD